MVRSAVVRNAAVPPKGWVEIRETEVEVVAGWGLDVVSVARVAIWGYDKFGLDSRLYAPPEAVMPLKALRNVLAEPWRALLARVDRSHLTPDACPEDDEVG